MAEQSPLGRLADAVGIVPDYHDEWGNRRVAPEATKIALLAAMGLPADNADAAAESLTRLDEQPWRRVLPPVAVWRCGDAGPQLPFVLPEGNGGRRMLWSLETEGGEAVQREELAEELPIVAHRMVDGVRMERRMLPVPAAPPAGYHRLRFYVGEEAHDMPFIAVPGRCHLAAPPESDGRMWGVAVQVYGLRSRDNWGIGDFADLRALTEIGGRLGADAIGLNPLHALFPHNPAHAGPYGPSSRLWLNVLYIHVPGVPDFAECEEAQALAGSDEFAAALAALRDAELVDYLGVAAAKFRILELLYVSFRSLHLGSEPQAAATERGAAFRRFQFAGGAPLERHATFEALSAHMKGAAWRTWPAHYRDPASAEVAAFVKANRERVEYFQYLQWIADEQLRLASDQAAALPMGIGLYHDLALAVDGNGADAWAQQGLYADGASIGAPPDAWNHLGQNWGMPPVNPLSLRERGYAPFAAVVRANMRHGGALRIDHVMALQRLFWIPAGAPATEGAYVRQPFEDLLGILTLESQRQRCTVIGEDLGTVPENFRERMHEARVLSYRLLYFQRDEHGEMIEPDDYPDLSTAVVGTHDLAPLPGFWAGRDLDLRTELGLYPSREMERQARLEREEFRRKLIAALQRRGLLPDEVPDTTGLTDEIVRAVYGFLARSRGLLVMAHLEDALGVTEQPNLPGTTQEHPNWRRKLPLTVEQLASDPRIADLAAVLRRIRPARRAGKAGKSAAGQ